MWLETYKRVQGKIFKLGNIFLFVLSTLFALFVCLFAHPFVSPLVCFSFCVFVSRSVVIRSVYSVGCFFIVYALFVGALFTDFWIVECKEVSCERLKARSKRLKAA